jgi:hypothetical protein
MFKSVGGGRAARLAAVDIDTGVADPRFAPPTPSAYVKAMALSGDRLYIGGAFAQLGTIDRPQLAALDAGSGALHDDWIPPPNHGGRFVGHTGTPTEGPDPGNIADLKVTADGTMVVIGGSFLHFGGRSGLVVLDAQTAQPTAWQPTLDTPRPVFGLGLWPGDGRTIFAAAGGPGGAVEAEETPATNRTTTSPPSTPETGRMTGPSPPSSIPRRAPRSPSSAPRTFTSVGTSPKPTSRLTPASPSSPTLASPPPGQA